MINKETSKENKEVETARKPDEINGIHVSTHIKIFDPNTNKVFVQQRGDS